MSAKMELIKNIKQILVQVICRYGKNCERGTHAKNVGSSDLFRVLHFSMYLCILVLSSGCCLPYSLMELHCFLLLEAFPDFSHQNQLRLATGHCFKFD